MIKSATQDKQNKSFRVIKTILTLLLLVALCLPVGTFGIESNTSTRPQMSVAALSSESMIVNNDTATTAKNTPVTIDVLANDSDLDGGMLWLASVSTPSHGTVAINSDFSITYTPEQDWIGTDKFTYTVVKPTGEAGYGEVTVVVIENYPPVAMEDKILTRIGQEVVFSPTANDLDPENDDFYIIEISQPNNGYVQLLTPTTVSYTPYPWFKSTDSFTYTVRDTMGAASMSTVTIYVSSEGNMFAAVADAFKTMEETTTVVNPLQNDILAEGQQISISVVEPPQHGIISFLEDQRISYTPTTNWYGIDEFSYRLIDSMGRHETATVLVQVLPVQDPPVAIKDQVVTTRNTEVVISPLSNDYDPDGDRILLNGFFQPANGTAQDLGDGRVLYTPKSDWIGFDSFIYIISDGNGHTAIGTVYIEVTEQNHSPVAVNDRVSTPKNTPITVPVLDNDYDPDGDQLVVEEVGSPRYGSAIIDADNNIEYVPPLDWAGEDSFLYTISDGQGGKSVGVVTITVIEETKVLPPVASDDFAATDQNIPVDIRVLANDTDPNGLHLTIYGASKPSHGTIVILAEEGIIRYSPENNWFGTDTFTYTVVNAEGLTSQARVTVTVRGVQQEVNRNPVAKNDTATTGKNNAIKIYVLANDYDTDGDRLNIGSVTQPRNGKVTINSDRTVTYTPNKDFSGIDTFTYTVIDGKGGKSVGTVTVQVIAPNSAPTANNDTAYTRINTAVKINVLANDKDPDGDALTVEITLKPKNGSARVNTDNSVTYTPNKGFYGTDSFTYTVQDGKGGKATAVVTITVTNPTTSKRNVVITLRVGTTKYYVGDQPKYLDSQPIIKGGRTLLPIRFIVEAMGGSVAWYPQDRRVVVQLGSDMIELWIGKNKARVNGKEQAIDPNNPQVVPEIVNSRTMVPLRFVAEKLGAEVGWFDKTKHIVVIYGPYKTALFRLGNSEYLANSNMLNSRIPPMMKNNKVFFDPQPVIEHFGGSFTWNSASKTLTIRLGSRSLTHTVGTNYAIVNGTRTSLDSSNSQVTSMVVNQRPLLPADFVAKSMNIGFVWDSMTQTLFMFYKK